jgi:hypothetical protein
MLIVTHENGEEYTYTKTEPTIVSVSQSVSQNPPQKFLFRPGCMHKRAKRGKPDNRMFIRLCYVSLYRFHVSAYVRSS